MITWQMTLVSVYCPPGPGGWLPSTLSQLAKCIVISRAQRLFDQPVHIASDTVINNIRAPFYRSILVEEWSMALVCCCLIPGFEFRGGHWWLSVVNIVCCSGSGLCDGPIPCSEKSSRVCVIDCGWSRVTFNLHTCERGGFEDVVGQGSASFYQFYYLCFFWIYGCNNVWKVLFVIYPHFS
jgi:hypothetical protein